MGHTTVFPHSHTLDTLHYPEESPFNTSRAGKTLETVKRMGLLSGRDRPVVEPEPAPRNVLERFHSARYLDVLQACSRGERVAEAVTMGLGTPDCPIFPDMYEYPVLAVGASIAGADLLLQGGVHVAFNPSGGYHHAHPETASGFCYLNDVVLACMALADVKDRVLFLDVDVHHCDGVQAAFYGRSDVMTISLHETGKELFPGTGFVDEIGEGEGIGYTVNCPLPVGTYDEAYLRVFRRVVLPLLDAYDPDVIVLELGMDALAGDPLAHLHLTNNTYADMVEAVLARGKPILAVGGGGYHVENTVRGWSLLWSILCGDSAGEDMSFGMGGVMMESTEWQGGLRDRVLISHGGQRQAVDIVVDRVIQLAEELIFPHHGLGK